MPRGQISYGDRRPNPFSRLAIGTCVPSPITLLDAWTTEIQYQIFSQLEAKTMIDSPIV